MISGRRGLLLVVVAALLLAVIRDGLAPSGESSPGADVVDFLGGGASDFQAVTPGRPPVFPADHGAHRDFRQEWWYFTGNLRDRSGRRFGMQLTFFRFGHGNDDAYHDSAWRHEHTFMAHFAISDIDGERLLAEQDYARDSLGLAGAEAEPFRVWVNGWSVRGEPDQAGFQARLSADGEEMAVDLALATNEAPLLQGEDGYSIKDAAGRSASYYYNLPNLAASGELRLGEDVFSVSGQVWMDREWSSQVLAKSQSGWDWLALRLADGSVLMAFQVRGDGEPFRYAMRRTADGQVRRFRSDQVELVPTGWWRGQGTSRYPVRWRLRIVDAGIDLAVAAAFDAQEVALDFRYWEGVVDVTGSVDNARVLGEGYLELTGY